MNTPTRHRIPAIVAIYAAFAFALFTRGKIPGQYYSFLLSALLMFASILWEIGDFSEDDGRCVNARERGRDVLWGILLFIGAISMGVMLPKHVAYIIFLLCFACVPVYTQILLGAVSVSRYFDFLAAVPFVPSEEGREVFASKSEDMMARIERVREKKVGSIAWVFCVGFFIALMLIADPMFPSRVGIASYSTFICVDIFICAFIATLCYFGKTVNQHFALCGAKYEQAFLNHSLRDEDMFELHRMMAHQVKKAAIIFAVVVYATTFCVFYLLLGS